VIRLSVCPIGVFVLALILGAAPARAQTTPAPPQTPDSAASGGSSTAQPAPSEEDDDARLRPMEPDYYIINVPTTLPLPARGGNFHLTHRFGLNFRQPGMTFGTAASNLFGLDEGATIELEYRFGVMKHLEAVIARTNVDKDIQFTAKYDAFHQGASRPIGFSGIIAVEGSNNFRERYEPSLGFAISRVIANRVSLNAAPIWVHNSAAETGITRDTFFVGLGTRIRIAPAWFLVGEMSPRASGYGPGDPEYGFGMEWRVGGHVFEINFSNTSATTFGQIARGGFPESLYLGYNLARKFF
jgi:hypothetical protein